jgi:F-type H+-transporting ATPase subunit a
MEQLAHVMEHVKPNVVANIGPLEITTTVVTTWLVMIILFFVILFLTRGMKVNPDRKRQHIIEMIVFFVIDLLESIIGKGARKYLPLVGTLFIFILFLNLSWFIPTMKPPTMDLSTTAAFAVTTIIVIQAIAIVNKGIGGYVKHFFEPLPFLFPLNVIEELVKPFSLALRLFGNMFGEEMVVVILFILLPLVLPTPIQLLGVLMGTIQALVFTMLPTVYIATFLHGH